MSEDEITQQSKIEKETFRDHLKAKDSYLFDIAEVSSKPTEQIMDLIGIFAYIRNNNELYKHFGSNSRLSSCLRISKTQASIDK